MSGFRKLLKNQCDNPLTHIINTKCAVYFHSGGGGKKEATTMRINEIRSYAHSPYRVSGFCVSGLYKNYTTAISRLFLAIRIHPSGFTTGGKRTPFDTRYRNENFLKICFSQGEMVTR